MLALMRGRLHLSIEDVQTVAAAVLRHRIILNFDAHAEGQTHGDDPGQDHPQRDGNAGGRQGISSAGKRAADRHSAARKTGAPRDPVAKIPARRGGRA